MSLRDVGVWVAAALGLAACSFDENSPSASCVEGQQASCPCTGGQIGVQRCRADGTFGTCVCSPVEDGAGASAGDASAGPPDPGTTGSNAGTGAAGQQAGAAGQDAPGGGEAGTGATAGTGASGQGEGGTGGSTSDAGSGGRGGDDDGSGGEGGRGESGEGGKGEAGRPAEPGEPYSQCTTDMDCDVGLICAIASQGPPGTGYCTVFCDAMNGGHCPQPRSGEVRGTCLAFANVCLLSGCQMDDCPIGMDCMFAGGGGPFGTGGFCQYPAR